MFDSEIIRVPCRCSTLYLAHIRSAAGVRTVEDHRFLIHLDDQSSKLLYFMRINAMYNENLSRHAKTVRKM